MMCIYRYFYSYVSLYSLVLEDEATWRGLAVAMCHTDRGVSHLLFTVHSSGAVFSF
jgi:hypothetical protein